MQNSKLLRKWLALATTVGMGGTAFQLSGCDQEIRGGVLGGLNSATNTLLTSLVDALFVSLDNNGQDDTAGDVTGGGDTTGGGGG